MRRHIAPLPRRSRTIVAALTLAVDAVACGGGGGSDTTTPPTQPPATATVASVAVATIAPVLVGATTQASATVRDANSNVLSGRTVSWSTANSSIATVSATGLVTGVAAGTTDVIATVEGVTGRTAITVNAPAAAVATVSVNPFTAILQGTTAQGSVVVRDASGATLTGRAVTWSTSNASIATVSASGVVSGIAPGTVTITATSEGRSGSATIEIINPVDIPFFESSPLGGPYVQGNLLDHDIPKEFVDNNGIFTTWWGEVLTNTGGMTDGHSGYDWNVPVGTPLLAVAAGRVVRVDESSVSFFCPPLNANVNNQKSVFIEHTLPGGQRIQTWYVHNSENRVTVGQTVTAGQVVALAGSTGCSTQSHLHFEVYLVSATTPTTLRTIDPYGWSGAGVDPWSVHPDGARSIQLWKPGVAPDLTRVTINNFTSTTQSAALVIGRIAYMGVDDARNPNNEYLEVALDTRVASSASLDGYRIRGDKSGLNFVIPSGITLNATRPSVRFYTGSGTNTATAFYIGRPSGVWSNVQDDCARLVSPNGGQYRWNLGNGCPLPGPAIVAPAPNRVGSRS